MHLSQFDKTRPAPARNTAPPKSTRRERLRHDCPIPIAGCARSSFPNAALARARAPGPVAGTRARQASEAHTIAGDTTAFSAAHLVARPVDRWADSISFPSHQSCRSGAPHSRLARHRTPRLALSVVSDRNTHAPRPADWKAAYRGSGPAPFPWGEHSGVPKDPRGLAPLRGCTRGDEGEPFADAAVHGASTQPGLEFAIGDGSLLSVHVPEAPVKLWGFLSGESAQSCANPKNPTGCVAATP